MDWFKNAVKTILLTQSKKKEKAAPGVDQKKFDSCVDQITKKQGSATEPVNAYAVCNATLKQEADSASANVQMLRAEVKPEKKKTKKKERAVKIKTVTAEMGWNAALKEADAKTDAPQGTRFRVVLLQEGLGNFRDAFFYTEAALQSAVDVFNGKKIFADHPSAIEEQVRPERSVRDVLGHFEKVSVEKTPEGRSQLVGDVVILGDEPFQWARSLMIHAVEYAKTFPEGEFVGLSINASGDASEAKIDDVIKTAPEACRPKLAEAKEQGIESVRLVKVINEAISCDLVTSAGAGGKIVNLLENDEMESQEGGPGSGRYPKGSGENIVKGKDDIRRARINYAGTQDLVLKKEKIRGEDSFRVYKTTDHGLIDLGRFVNQIDAENAWMDAHNQLKNPKKEAKMEMENELTPGVTDHADVEQDIELIKKMIADALAGKEIEAEQEDEAEVTSLEKVALEAYQAGVGCGMAKEEALDFAKKTLKAAKYMAAKQAETETQMPPAPEAEKKAIEGEAETECETEVEAEGKDALKQVESLKKELLAAKGKLAFIENEKKKEELEKYIDAKLGESKLPRVLTKAFREAAGEIKTKEQFETAWKIFTAAQPAKAEGLSFAFTEKASIAENTGTKFDFSNCVR